jgi:predicted RNA binding protein YcfA (HicA-like mRNA interferase family)
MSADDLIKLLKHHGYLPTRQTGSHVRMTCDSEKGTHHLTIPKHGTLRVGTLNQILSDVASYLGKSKEDLFWRQLAREKRIAEMESVDNLSREALIWFINSSRFIPSFCTLFKNR